MIDALFEFLPYALIAFVSYQVGSWVRTITFMYNITKRPDDFLAMVAKIKEIEQEECDEVLDAIEVKTETVNDLVYAYNKATGEFLAQAQNLNQVMVLAAKRYPGKKFWHPEFK